MNIPPSNKDMDYNLIPEEASVNHTEIEMDHYGALRRTVIDSQPSFGMAPAASRQGYARTEQNDLIRICVISILLTIGYGFTFTEFIKNKGIGITTNIWGIVYLSFVAWLFAVCCVMIFVTLAAWNNTDKFGFKTSVCKRLSLCCLLVIGICGHTGSIITGLESTKNAAFVGIWEFEIIYSLLPLYIIILILFFGKSSERGTGTKIVKFIAFSVVLCITPGLRLISLSFPDSIVFTSVSVASSDKFSEESLLQSAYLSVCTALIILSFVHIIFFLKHYNSGASLKFIIVAALMFSVIVCVETKVGFDQYDAIDSKARIYYYYGLLTTLYFVYFLEMFIKVPPQFIQDTEMARYLDKRDSVMPKVSSDETIRGVIKAFPDYKPRFEHKDQYFDEIKFDHMHDDRRESKQEKKRLKDSIAAIVPFYNESASEIHATLRSLYHNFEYMKRKRSQFQITHFNVLLVGDGWFKADLSTKQYLTKLYNLTDIDESFIRANRDVANQKKEAKEQKEQPKQKKKKTPYTVVLQTKQNKPLCINPFNNGEEDIYLKVTTIIKIDNRKKANSHEWFLGEFGFAEHVQCDYMYFTDAYSTINQRGLYKFVMHMNKPQNRDVVCCTGRARVYTIEQEIEFKLLLKEKRTILTDTGLPPVRPTIYDEESKEERYPGWDATIFYDPRHDTQEKRWWQEDHDENVFYRIQDIEYDYRLSVNAHLRKCQMFEFEALYGTIGAYLLGGFLPVIPGPCGFYRSSYMLKDEVRGWYFDKIHQENTWDDMDLVLGNMKLAEDRILTVTSILNCDVPVRHSLLSEVVFYFDPMPSLSQLMKQRRRWINGSVATIVFVLRKISFSNWNVNFFRRIYVLTIWHMQLYMFLVLYISPPLLFIVAFQYGLAAILTALLVGDQSVFIEDVVTALMVLAWVTYIFFIYYAQSSGKPKKRRRNNDDSDDCILCCFACKKKHKKINCACLDLSINKVVDEDKKIKWNFKPKSVKAMLYLSYCFGALTLIGSFVSFGRLLFTVTGDTDEIFADTFSFFVLIIETIFFLQTFILAPLFSKDWRTFEILIKSGIEYFLYAPFYVTFFFVNAVANVHDLSWGTRPDNAEAETGNKKAKWTTYGLLIILVITNILISIVFTPFTEGTWGRIIFFAILSLPAIFQIFFSLIWLAKERFIEMVNTCLPKKIDVQYDWKVDKYV